MNKRGIDETPTVNAASPYIMPLVPRVLRSAFPCCHTKGSIGQERRETCKQAEEKIQVGMVANSCSASALANLAVPKELRPAAGRLLVALGPVRVLFICAKHLFVAARRGAATMPLRFSSLRRGLLLVAVNHEKGEPHKHSEALGFI